MIKDYGRWFRIDKYIIHRANNYTNGIGDNKFILWFNWYFILRWTRPIRNRKDS